jgi:hypothetical protein
MMYVQLIRHYRDTDFLQLVVASAESMDNKRKRASSEAPKLPSNSQKKRRVGKRGSHTEAVGDVADAIQSLANNFSSSAPTANVMATTTPERRAAALKLMEDDGEFSEDESVSVICLFAHKKAVHDTFLSLSNKERRTKYVRKELDM